MKSKEQILKMKEQIEKHKKVYEKDLINISEKVLDQIWLINKIKICNAEIELIDNILGE